MTFLRQRRGEWKREAGERGVLSGKWKEGGEGEKTEKRKKWQLIFLFHI